MSVAVDHILFTASSGWHITKSLAIRTPCCPFSSVLCGEYECTRAVGFAMPLIVKFNLCELRNNSFQFCPIYAQKQKQKKKRASIATKAKMWSRLVQNENYVNPRLKLTTDCCPLFQNLFDRIVYSLWFFRIGAKKTEKEKRKKSSEAISVVILPLKLHYNWLLLIVNLKVISRPFRKLLCGAIHFWDSIICMGNLWPRERVDFQTNWNFWKEKQISQHMPNGKTERI